jgi:NAD(P)H-dependent FMN reductase
MKPQILVILGSTRQGRTGERVADWLMRRLREQSAAEFTLVDLRDHPLPLFDNPHPPSFGQYAPEAEGWARLIGSADGYVFVAPEYNHGYPAVLKNALDHVYREWNRKPMAVVSYGGGPAGGFRGAEQLRQVAVELQMVPVREQLAIPVAWMAFDDSGELRQPMADETLARMVDDLVWWALALKPAREAQLVRSS